MKMEKPSCRHFVYAIVILSSLALPFDKAAQAANMSNLIGQRFTEVREDKNKVINGKSYMVRKELLINRADGTKTNIERYYAGSHRVSETIVTYKWGVENNVYWSVCQTVLENGTASACSYRSEYNIISAAPQEIRYKSRTTGVTYASRRVPDRFRLP